MNAWGDEENWLSIKRKAKHARAREWGEKIRWIRSTPCVREKRKQTHKKNCSLIERWMFLWTTGSIMRQWTNWRSILVEMKMNIYTIRFSSYFHEIIVQRHSSSLSYRLYPSILLEHFPWMFLYLMRIREKMFDHGIWLDRSDPNWLNGSDKMYLVEIHSCKLEELELAVCFRV